MGNMSYCRFENTAQDLSDCYEAIQNGETTELNDYETRGLEELLELLCPTFPKRGGIIYLRLLKMEEVPLLFFYC